MDIEQLRDLIIAPTLKQLKMYSPQAEQLVVGTICQESLCKYLKQLGNGPALGLAQMEPATHKDIWLNYLKFQPALSNEIRALLSAEADDVLEVAGYPADDELISNLKYMVAMCRIHYWRRPERLPKENDFKGLAQYWKSHYNTAKGAGTVQDFLSNFPTTLYERRLNNV